MKKVANFGNKKLQEEQFDTLCKILNMLKTDKDLKLFLSAFFTESELVYLSQRLNIIRMLAKNFSYAEIKDTLNVPSATITRAKQCLEKGGDKFRKAILVFKFKERKGDAKSVKAVGDFTFPRMPGAIKL